MKEVKGGFKIPKNAKFSLNVPRAIGELEAALRRFPVKNILYNTMFRGKGLEFDSYREFDSSGDDSSMIDWKATLRANATLAKKYVEERDLDIFFVVDVSNSMLFGSRNRLKSEYVVEIVCALSHLIINSGDKIALLMYSDKVVKFLPPKNSKNQFALFVKYLSDTSFYGGGHDLNGAIEYALRMVKNKYTVFIFVSDFVKLGKETDRSLRLLGSQYESIAIMVRDQLDDNLPRTNYQFALQDPYSGRQIVLDPEIAVRRYREAVIRQKGILKEIFKKARVDLLELQMGKPFALHTVSFLKARSGGKRV
jgi:uncharacterized protein (DUF58 family)